MGFIPVRRKERALRLHKSVRLRHVDQYDHVKLFLNDTDRSLLLICFIQ